MRPRRLRMLATLLVLLSVIFWTPFSGWFIEIFSPTLKVFVLNALLLTSSILLFKSISGQHRRNRGAFRITAGLLLFAGLLSQIVLTFSTIPAPLDSFGWNSDRHRIQVGSHCVEARKTRVHDLSSASGEIIIREIKPLAMGIRLVKKPIAIADPATSVDIQNIDNNSFTYQFFDEEVNYPVCDVHFNN